MEGGSLFNSEFTGSSFLWWIGQIRCDESVWRDNLICQVSLQILKELDEGFYMGIRVRIMEVIIVKMSLQ